MSLREWITSFPAPRVATPATTATADTPAGDLSQLPQGVGTTKPRHGPPVVSQLSQLSQGVSDRRPDAGALDLRDVAPVALRFGSLVICEHCQHFDARAHERPDGWCRCHAVETWGRVPFDCPAFAKRTVGRSPDEWIGFAGDDQLAAGFETARKSAALGGGGRALGGPVPIPPDGTFTRHF